MYTVWLYFPFMYTTILYFMVINVLIISTVVAVVEKKRSIKLTTNDKDNKFLRLSQIISIKTRT